MADISGILGAGWVPPSERYTDPPEVQALDAIAASGLTPPDGVIMDGKIRRFNTGTKGRSGGNDKSGWYIFFGDGIPAGRFGCWREGFEQSWRADIGRVFTPQEEMRHQMRMAEAQIARDAEQEKVRAAVADSVEAIWTGAQPASADHPYLARKGVQPHGARITGDGRLVVPLYTPDGELSSLQYIAHDGQKRYHQGGKTGDCLWMVGAVQDGDTGALYIAEGFATAATIHEATGRPCVVAYSASNLPPVTGAMRSLYGAQQDIVIVADNDESGTGQKYADQASAKHGARVITPPERGDANDYAQAGGDLAALLAPAVSTWLVQADDFSAQPAPIRWLVKGWLQENSLMMIHGPSGGGKTFVLLDMVLRMASAVPDWIGHKVKPCSVIYLAGEGHHGLRGRIAGWKDRHQVQSLKMWLSRDGCDLNTPDGYRRVTEAIRALPREQWPSLICVDTLHRFLAGDENSAQDAKTMLDACAGLMREFECSVLLVHHTGVSEEAQHRARGSSAWRGALDIEISVVPATDSRPMQIIQRKSKDAELAEALHARLVSYVIPGWLDEDGEPVTTAVVEPEDAPSEQKKADSKLVSWRKDFEAAWLDSGSELDDMGRPYLARSPLIDWLQKARGLTLATAQKYIRPGQKGQMIAELLTGEIITPYLHGWSIADAGTADAMRLLGSA